MFEFNEIEQISKSIFTILKVEECFIKTEFHERYFKQLTRNMDQFNNLMRRLEIGEHKFESFMKWHEQNLPYMPYNKNNLILELITLTCYQGLATYEFFKRFLLLVLDLNKLNSKTNSRLGQNSMLGDLAKSISKLPCVDKETFDELFDVKFRNALAHDSWYIENNSFRYLSTDEKEIIIPLEGFQKKVFSIHGLTSSISIQYFKEYFPDMVTEYEKDVGKIMDDIFPIYQAKPHAKQEKSDDIIK